MTDYEIIDRHTAKAQGRKDYFTGVPCIRGHVALRWIKSGRCRHCAIEDTQKWRDPEKTSEGTKYKPLPSREYLHETFSYKDGKLYWKATRPMSHFKSEKGYKTYLTHCAGKEAGHKHKVNSYVEVRIDKKLHKVNRVVYKMFYDFDESLQVDHRNRDPSDNRIENLRVVTNQENSSNRVNTRNKANGIYEEIEA